jgi:hypothetical protein
MKSCMLKSMNKAVYGTHVLDEKSFIFPTHKKSVFTQSKSDAFWIKSVNFFACNEIFVPPILFLKCVVCENCSVEF